MVNKRLLLLLLLIILVLLLFQVFGIFSFSPPAPPSIRIISLKNNLPKLFKVANSWHSDAYLYNVNMPLDPEGLWLIGAGFQSPTANNEQLDVELWPGGKILTKTFTLETSVYQQSPITGQDLPVDSQAALDILLKSLNAQHWFDPTFSHLGLERNLAQPNEPVVWVLSLFGTESGNYTYLDPATGKVGAYIK